ncbi:MAG: hypothetical protein ACK4K9_01830 [Bacteroidia bacterium]
MKINKSVLIILITIVIACNKSEQSELNDLSNIETLAIPGDQQLDVFKKTSDNELFLAFNTLRNARVLLLSYNFKIIKDLSENFGENTIVKDIFKASNKHYYFTTYHKFKTDFDSCQLWHFDENLRFVNKITVKYIHPNNSVYRYNYQRIGSIIEIKNGELTVIGLVHTTHAFTRLYCPTIYKCDLNLNFIENGNKQVLEWSYPQSAATKGILKSNGNINLCGSTVSEDDLKVNEPTTRIVLNNIFSNGEIKFGNNQSRYGKEGNFEVGYDIADFDDETSVGLAKTTGNAIQGKSDIWLFLINKDADTIKSKVLVLPDEDIPNSVCAMGDGNFLIAGITKSIVSDKFVTFVLKIDKDFNLKWIKHYGGDAAGGKPVIIKTGYNKYSLAFGTRLFGNGLNELDICLINIDESGNIIN